MSKRQRKRNLSNDIITIFRRKNADLFAARPRLQGAPLERFAGSAPLPERTMRRAVLPDICRSMNRHAKKTGSFDGRRTRARRVFRREKYNDIQTVEKTK